MDTQNSRANTSVYPNINVSETNTQYHSNNSGIIYRYYPFEVLNIWSGNHCHFKYVKR